MRVLEGKGRDNIDNIDNIEVDSLRFFSAKCCFVLGLLPQNIAPNFCEIFKSCTVLNLRSLILNLNPKFLLTLFPMGEGG